MMMMDLPGGWLASYLASNRGQIEQCCFQHVRIQQQLLSSDHAHRLALVQLLHEAHHKSTE